MRVCIVGASGKLGKHLVGLSLNRGHEVIAVCREQSVPKLADFDSQITIVPGATDDRDVIQRAVAGCDGVLAVLVPRGVHGYASGTAQAVLDYAEPEARLVFSCGWHITVDGQEYEMRASLLVVANCAEVIPPFARFRRGMSFDDGVFDVVALRADTFGQSLQALWEFVRESDRASGVAGLVGHARGKTITVATEAPLPMQLDGDLAGTTPFTAEVVPGAIRVIAPRENGR